MKNSEFFYDPMRAIYDSGADYLTREKHRLVVMANGAWGRLLNLSCYYDEISEKLKIPFSKQEIDDDMDKVSALKRKFKDISEIKVGDNWEYSVVNSLRVLCSLMASTATLLLNSAL